MDLHIPKFEPFLGPQYPPPWINAGATTPSPSRPRSTSPAAPTTSGRPNLRTFVDRPVSLPSTTVPPNTLPGHTPLNSHSRAHAPPFRNMRELRAEISKIEEEIANVEHQLQGAARPKQVGEREKERVWERLSTTSPILIEKKLRGSNSAPHIRLTTSSARPRGPRPVPHPRSSPKDNVMGPSPGTAPSGHGFIYEADPFKRKEGAWERRGLASLLNYNLLTAGLLPFVSAAQAEERVNVRRQVEDDAGRHEEVVWCAEPTQIEEVIIEQEGDHQTVSEQVEQEQERQRVEDEQRRLEAERKVIAEQQRREEKKKRRAEEERREQYLARVLRRFEEESATEWQKLHEARARYNQQRQLARKRRKRGSPQLVREMFEEALREERQRMEERLADQLIPSPTVGRPRTPNPHTFVPRQSEAGHKRRGSSLGSVTSPAMYSSPQISDIPWFR